MDTDAKLPLGARLLILTVVGIGAAGVLVRLPEVVSWQSRDIVTWLFLAAGVALAEQFPVPLRHRSETLNFSMTEAVWVGGLILARPSVLTLAVAAGLLCGQFLRRWTTYKVAFNVGQFLVALTVAQAVYRVMEPHPTLQPRAWLHSGLRYPRSVCGVRTRPPGRWHRWCPPRRHRRRQAALAPGAPPQSPAPTRRPPR